MTYFLFLVDDRILNASIWRSFFDSASVQYGVLVHCQRPYVGADFPNHVLQRRAPTRWGFLMDAELALLRVAVADRRVDRFVFLSASCLPLKPLDQIVADFASDKGSRIYEQRLPDFEQSRRPKGFPLRHFRKQSQWMVLDRGDAECLLSDGSSAIHLRSRWFADEHYPISSLSLHGRLDETRSLPTTFVDWSGPTAMHPRVLPPKLTPGDRLLLKSARDNGACFARKAHDGAEDLIAALP